MLFVQYTQVIQTYLWRVALQSVYCNSLQRYQASIQFPDVKLRTVVTGYLSVCSTICGKIDDRWLKIGHAYVPTSVMRCGKVGFRQNV